MSEPPAEITGGEGQLFRVGQDQAGPPRRKTHRIAMPETNIADMPGTEVTDRDLLLYIAGRLDKLHDELESFRPLLDMIKGRDGKPDMIGLMQARREAKRAARHG